MNYFYVDKWNCLWYYIQAVEGINKKLESKQGEIRWCSSVGRAADL